MRPGSPGGTAQRRRWGSVAREIALSRSALLGPPHGEPETVRRQLRDSARALETTRDDAAAAVAWALALDERARLRLLARPRVCDSLRARLAELCGEQRAEGTEPPKGTPAIAALIADGRRRAALADARAALVAGEDPVLIEMAALMVALAVRGPRLDLGIGAEVGGDATLVKLLAGGAVRVALGEKVTLGRVGASMLVTGPGVAPEHAALWREPGKGVVIADLGSSVGTTVAGARVAAALPIGDGLQVELAGRVPVRVAPLDPTRAASPIVVDAGEVAYLASLGVLSIGGGGELRPPPGPRWVLWMEHTARSRRDAPAADAYVLPWVILRAPSDARPHLDDTPAAVEVDLCFGDQLRSAPELPALLTMRPPVLEP
jgi:hypothetical protein